MAIGGESWRCKRSGQPLHLSRISQVFRRDLAFLGYYDSTLQVYQTDVVQEAGLTYETGLLHFGSNLPEPIGTTVV